LFELKGNRFMASKADSGHCSFTGWRGSHKVWESHRAPLLQLGLVKPIDIKNGIPQ
jgi:hypothetical protein